jgi:hypothetical protein
LKSISIHIQLSLNPGKGAFGSPVDSTQGMNYEQKWFLFIIAALFLGYLIIGVKRALNKERINNGRNKTKNKRKTLGKYAK